MLVFCSFIHTLCKFLAIFPLNASNLVILLRGSCPSEEIYLLKQPTLLLYYDGYQILTGRNTQVHCIVIDAVFKKGLHDVLYTWDIVHKTQFFHLSLSANDSIDMLVGKFLYTYASASTSFCLVHQCVGVICNVGVCFHHCGSSGRQNPIYSDTCMYAHAHTQSVFPRVCCT